MVASKNPNDLDNDLQGGIITDVQIEKKYQAEPMKELLGINGKSKNGTKSELIKRLRTIDKYKLKVPKAKLSANKL